MMEIIEIVQSDTALELMRIMWGHEKMRQTICEQLVAFSPDDLVHALSLIHSFCKRKNDYTLLEYLYAEFGIVFYMNVKRVTGLLVIPGSYRRVKDAHYTMQELDEQFAPEKRQESLRERLSQDWKGKSMSEKRTTVYLLDVKGSEYNAVCQKIRQFEELYSIPFVGKFRSMIQSDLLCFVIQIEGEHEIFSEWCKAALITDRVLAYRKMDVENMTTAGNIQTGVPIVVWRE